MRYKFSIRTKLMLLVICIVGGVIAFTWFLNLVFSERYYIRSEEKSIVNAFEEVKNILEQEEIEDADSDYKKRLESISNSTNIRMMIAKGDEYSIKQKVIFSSAKAGSMNYKEMIGYLDELHVEVFFAQKYIEIQENNKKLFQKDEQSWMKKNLNSDIYALLNNGYFRTRIMDRTTGQNGIYLFGSVDGGYLVAMRISLEGIHSSAMVSSHFLAYIGVLGVLMGSVLVFCFATFFTRPIKQLAAVSNKMAQLDFDAKVDIQSGDELQELGEAMNQMSEKLEQTIADLKEANLELQKDIEKKDEIDKMRQEFLSHVSHELKTPIALIQGYAEGLKENITDDEESKDFYCEVIADEAQKMNMMVKKLLTLNQIEFGKNQVNMQRFNICEVIRNKMNASQILFAKKNTTVEFAPEDDVFVWADEFMIEEVFSNYLSNALNHVKPDGMIRIYLERMEKEVRVHVYNDGQAIPEEELEKLWIKFYKVDKARTREYGGNGIGLSIVAATMNAHGKQFGVENKEHGVDFYFDLDTE